MISQKMMQLVFTKLDIQMFHDESWKPIYIGVKRSNVKGRGYNVYVGLQTLCNIAAAAAYVRYAGFFLLKCPAALALHV